MTPSGDRIPRLLPTSRNAPPVWAHERPALSFHPSSTFRSSFFPIQSMDPASSLPLTTAPLHRRHRSPGSPPLLTTSLDFSLTTTPGFPSPAPSSPPPSPHVHVCCLRGGGAASSM